MIITTESILPDDKGQKYKVLSPIKSGGQGQVFLCERDSDKEQFALKTMLNVFPSEMEYHAFQNELKAAQEIENENVIRYVYMHDGTKYKEYPPYIIMEYANQGTLRDVLNAKRDSRIYFTNAELTEMFLQLASGMQAINATLVHRDIKPENILLKENVLKITDFGLAKYKEAVTRSVTFKGYGTQPYYAPEAWKNETNTIKMDIYSMGIVFYELATLRYPYKVENDDYEEMHLYGSVINPTTYNSELAPNLVSIINKMLQKPKSKRFDNWQEIIDLLIKGNPSSISNGEIFSLAQEAVKIQNVSDSVRQRKQAEETRKRNEWNNHVKNIMFYFNEEIIKKFEEFAEAYNSQYASGKVLVDTKRFDLTSERNKILIKLPDMKSINISLSVVDPERFTEYTGYIESNGIRTPISKKQSIPCCGGKKVIAWGSIQNLSGQGYNILLLENGKDEYGDWYILYNKNSGLNVYKRRKEPFAFEEKELPKEIGLIDCTHIYSSKLEKYNMARFKELIINE